MNNGDMAGEPGFAGEWQTVAAIELPSRPGNDRLAAELVCCTARFVGMNGERLQRLETAVAEAALNALEHGNVYNTSLPVVIRVFASAQALSVQVTDYGTSGPIPTPAQPDLQAKLSGEQTPNGWGFFLIEKMVDAMRRTGDDTHHTVELLLYLRGEQA